MSSKRASRVKELRLMAARKSTDGKVKKPEKSKSNSRSRNKRSKPISRKKISASITVQTSGIQSAHDLVQLTCSDDTKGYLSLNARLAKIELEALEIFRSNLDYDFAINVSLNTLENIGHLYRKDREKSDVTKTLLENHKVYNRWKVRPRDKARLKRLKDREEKKEMREDSASSSSSSS